MIHFYLFSKEKKIVASDLPQEKIKQKFGSRFEILNSIKDKDFVEIVKVRVLRGYPDFSYVETFHRKAVFTEESRRKISLSKLGKPRDELTRLKISLASKGRSNFQGKRHSDETKQKMAEKKLGNTHTKEYHWAHDPRSDKETRVKDRKNIPDGFSIGRDYYSTEPGLFHFRERVKSRSRNR